VQNAYTLTFGGLLLLAARAVQGIGAAIAAPSTLALLTVSFPQLTFAPIEVQGGQEAFTAVIKAVPTTPGITVDDVDRLA